MSRHDRIVAAVMVGLVVAGSICVAVALYGPAWANDAAASLLLACLMPAYLAGIYCTPGVLRAFSTRHVARPAATARPSAAPADGQSSLPAAADDPIPATNAPAAAISALRTYFT
jgi:hypothetical protein